MSHRWAHRAAATLAAAALVVPLTATSATAAKAPGVPGVGAVAKIYPHLAGAELSETTSTKVRGVTKKCKQGKVIKGASLRSAYYMPADPADIASTADKPSVTVTALRFRSAAAAKGYLRSAAKAAKACADTGVTGPDVKAKVSKINVKLGDERWGYKIKLTTENFTVFTNSLLVRQGKHIVTTGTSSQQGAPAVKKSVKLTKVALKAAR